MAHGRYIVELTPIIPMDQIHKPDIVKRDEVVWHVPNLAGYNTHDIDELVNGDQQKT